MFGLFRSKPAAEPVAKPEKLELLLTQTWYPIPARDQLPPLPEGFTPWYCRGGPPSDWDGKWVFCEDGTYGLVESSPVQWGEFFPNMGRRIIGYKRRPPVIDDASLGIIA